MSIEEAVIIHAPNTKAGVAVEHQFLTDRLGRRDVDWRPVWQGVKIREKRRYDQIRVELIPSGEFINFYFDVTEFFGKP